MPQVDTPLVSAVIPVYNGEAFLADAIRSVLAQTYPRVECIVVDDGSTDSSAAVAAAFGNAVHLIKKPNGGVASARNCGAKVAKGDYIAFLDADDIWLPELLDREVAVLQANPKLGLVYASLHFVDAELKRIGEMTAPDGSVALRNSLLLELPVMTMITSATLPTKVFHAIGGFDERLTTSADTDFSCRIASAYPVDRINEHLALYRQHGSQMHLNPDAMEHDMLLIFQKQFDGNRLPAEVALLRNRAYANLNLTLAVAYFKQGHTQKALSRLLRALRYHPARVVTQIWKRVTTGSGQFTAPEPA
jgi:glycosyltransferase involved in cell wall biosynthesis